MNLGFYYGERSILAPDVVQTSAKDSGAACLKAMLNGYGITPQPEQLSLALDTGSDIMSIDVLERAAGQLGLRAEQIMVPPEHLLLPPARLFPAIVVVKQPNGRTHFVLLWRRFGRFIQIMDPASGRSWLPGQRFLEQVYIHTVPVRASDWRAAAASSEFQAALRQRLTNLKLNEGMVSQLLRDSLADPAWRSLAALDAAQRVVDSMARAGGLQKGEPAEVALRRIYEQAQQVSSSSQIEGLLPAAIPLPYWSILPLPENGTPKHSAEQMLLRGAVLLRVRGRETAAPQAGPLNGEQAAQSDAQTQTAREQRNSQINRTLWRTLLEDGLLTPQVLLFALVIAAGGVTLEALLLQGVMELGNNLKLAPLRMGGLVVLFVFFFALILLEMPIMDVALRLGRRLETRLRVSFLEKIPLMGDQYFHGRPVSDLTQRAYSLRQIRSLPRTGVDFLNVLFQFLLTAAGIVWLDRGNLVIIVVAIIITAILTSLTGPLLTNPNLRMRIYGNDLTRFYLDALLGLIPIRVHGAERALRREHEARLVEWMGAQERFNGLTTFLKTMVAFIYAFVTILILFRYVVQGGETRGLLLLAYWTLNLPNLLNALTSTIIRYPYLHTIASMLFEPIAAEPESATAAHPHVDPDDLKTKTAAAIAMQAVTIKLAGQTILSNINLTIRPGEHVGIVGPSGAGKSTLVGVLLGWNQPVTGQVLLDGAPLSGSRLQALRAATAWVDPGVQIWNRSLLDNLQYGAGRSDTTPLGYVFEQADLFAMLEKFPDGLQTTLGEAGRLVSGGEGQRVRLGRAMYRKGVRLVILDEPFRGLERSQRREMLRRARQYWQEVTLICITHDVGDIQDLERTLVIENGHIVEDGSPQALSAESSSRFRALLTAEEAVRKSLWAATGWRRFWLDDGRLEEGEA